MFWERADPKGSAIQWVDRWQSKVRRSRLLRLQTRLEGLKSVDIDEWERLTDDCNKWRSLIMERLLKRETHFLRNQRRRRKNQNEWVYLLLLLFVWCIYCVLSLFCVFINVHAKPCGHSTYGRFSLEWAIIIYYYTGSTWATFQFQKSKAAPAT